ncbi:MAG: dihydrofolate reductase [Paludibacteraceae bacterium]|jgi:Dihydrofolate reductase|nr:dihydrofolate reductase [Paludibacteraceae bacterium]
MEFTIIAAVADNLAIGKDNQLLWHLSGDMKHFKFLTTGHTVLMGRNTYLSIGRPLPNRRNIILSRTMKEEEAPGCEIIRDLSVLESDPTLRNEEIFVMGGGQIYELMMPLANKLCLTRVHTTPEADTFFPAIQDTDWQEYSRECFSADEKNDHDYEFVNYIRKKQ